MATVIEGVEMGRVNVDIVLANNQDIMLSELGSLSPDKVRRIRTQGLVDTGSNHTVLPQSFVEQLGLPIKGEATVRYSDQRSATRKIAYELHVELLGREGTYRAIVEPNRDSILIGLIVLEDLDFLVDPGRQVLRPRDPEHILTEIE